MRTTIFSVPKRRHSACSGSLIRTGRIALAALAGIAVLSLTAVITLEGDSGDREVLKGITSIGVEIEDLPRMAEKLGVKKESLKMEVASRLKQAGIGMASDDALKLNPSLPFLKVSLIIGYSKPSYIYAVVVGLNEKVSLERDPRIISYAMPWWRIVKGEHAGEGDIAAHVQETLVYIMNEFIANYNAAHADAAGPGILESEQQRGDHGYDRKEQEKK
jgi:hypothetical protein